MDDVRNEHPDEGTIHAWLDNALDDASASALAAHVAACEACAARVAEARGLIAGASRIVGALDVEPSATAPAWGQPAATPAARPAAPGAGSAWRRLRVTPARAAIAATVLVAVGVSLTYTRGAVDTEALRMRDKAAAVQSATMENAAAGAPAGAVTGETTGAAASGAAMTPPRDALLDSAVARNVASAQPRRMMKAAPGLAPPVPEPGRAGAAALEDEGASRRVAAARAAIQEQRESAAGAAPDRVAANAPGVAKGAVRDESVTAARRADSAAAPVVGAMAASAPATAMPRSRARVVMPAPAPAPECYRVESANGTTAAWGSVPLPLILALDGGARARVLTVAGQPTGATASVIRAGGDSLLFQLRLARYEGSLALGAAGDARAGVMRSRETSPTPESLAAPAVPVVARRIGCPA